MTRFEASVIMFMVMAIMLILLFGVISVISILNDIKQQHENIKDNILDELRTMNSQSICWNELTDNQKSEILYRLTHHIVESPFKPPFNPTCETTNNEE